MNDERAITLVIIVLMVRLSKALGRRV